MARKKVVRELKLQIPAGKATPAPPVGPALGQAQVNIPQFVSQFNEATRDQMGYVIPVIIYVYDDRTFSFVTKTPPDVYKRQIKKRGIFTLQSKKTIQKQFFMVLMLAINMKQLVNFIWNI